MDRIAKCRFCHDPFMFWTKYLGAQDLCFRCRQQTNIVNRLGLSDIEDLADLIHYKFCYGSHEMYRDNCRYYSEDGWNGYQHVKYKSKAINILSIISFNEAVEMIKLLIKEEKMNYNETKFTWEVI